MSTPSASSQLATLRDSNRPYATLIDPYLGIGLYRNREKRRVVPDRPLWESDREHAIGRHIARYVDGESVKALRAVVAAFPYWLELFPIHSYFGGIL